MGLGGFWVGGWFAAPAARRASSYDERARVFGTTA